MISDLGALASNILNRIDKSFTSYSHVKKKNNVPMHFLVRTVLESDVFLEWTKHILMM